MQRRPVQRRNTVHTARNCVRNCILATFMIATGPITAALITAGSGCTVLAQTVDTSQQREQLQELQTRIQQSKKHSQELEKKAAKISIEVSDLRTRLITAARNIQDREEKITDLENQVAGLKAEKTEREASLKKRRGQLASTLAAMERLSQQPPQLLLIKPDTALDTARSASLLGLVLPELHRQAKQISKDITELDKVRTRLEAERKALGAELVRLNNDRTKMDKMLAARKAQQQELTNATSAERKRIAAYADKAKNISELIDELEREAAERQRAAKEAAQRLERRPGQNTKAPSKDGARVAAIPPTSQSLDRPHGTLPLPVRGKLVRGFGDHDSSGLISKGITIETRPNAQVVSPTDGRIVFAGPFRDYGRLLIIAHGKGYHTLLAGLGRIDGVVGQWVLAGEPVGQMGNSTNSTGETYSKLYIELRKMGKPINPLPYLAAGLGKVSG